MIPNLKMGYYHQREYLERPCNIQMSEKLSRKPLKDSMEGFEYSSLLTSKTYSILPYVVGGFVGSKSQMNNNKHNLSYDLSAAIFNLLNPCKYEREKNLRKNNENFYSTAPKLSSEVYDKYIVRSSQKGKMINLGLEWLEDYIIGFNEKCYNSNQMEKSFNCDKKQDSSDIINIIGDTKMDECLNSSVSVKDRVSLCESEPEEKENLSHSYNLSLCERVRKQSECSVESNDSESFIVFDGPYENEEKSTNHSWRLEISDSDCEDNDNDDNGDYDDDDDDDDDDDYYYYEYDDEDDGDGDNSNCCDEYDICSLNKELAEANDKWMKNYEGVESRNDEKERKVRFNDVVKVNRMVAWDYAYRAARSGPWEQMARDRVRFRERILRLSSTISPILKKEHRDKIYKELYS